MRELTDGQGADVVVEVVGHPAAIDEGLKLLGQFGRYVEIGNISIGKTFEFDPSRFVFANKTMVGVSLYDPAVLSRALDFLAEHQHTLPFDRLATTAYSLDDINDRLRRRGGQARRPRQHRALTPPTENP